MDPRIARIARFFFFISGLAALVYEVVWLRMLGLVFGNTTHAVAAVLTVYMAGLGLGSWALGRRADRWSRLLLAYGLLEIGVGLYAAASPSLLQLIEFLFVGYARTFQPSPAGLTAARLGLSFLVLFPPTFLMGATLPVLVKFFVRQREAIGPGVALLYGLNTAGAVTGTLLAGFCFLPVLGIRASLAFAVALNLVIGVFACLLGISDRYRVQAERTTSSPRRYPVPLSELPGTRRWVLLGLLVSGACAMVYEVAWTRTLASTLNSSTYAFTLMLAVFLLGLALGSGASERVLRRRPARWLDWAALQSVIVLFVLFTLPVFDDLGIVTVRLAALTIGHPLWLESARFLLCGLLMIVPTFCFGALLPVSASLYSRDPARVGGDLGLLYLANTAGNIAGSLAAGFLLIPALGIHRTFLAAAGAGTALAAGAVALSTGSAAGRGARSGRPWGALVCLAMVGAAAAGTVSAWTGPGWDPRLITAGLHVRPFRVIGATSPELLGALFDLQTLFYREGANSTVSVMGHDQRYLRVNGKADASTGADMPTQVLSGHLPLLLHPSPRRALVIGFGSGSTSASVLAHPDVRADCAEIEPAVLEAAPFFDEINRRSYLDPRFRAILNDARNHLLVEAGNYDVIISEPSNPWMAGTATLFSTDFYRLVRKRLNDGGIFCQWLQAYTLHPQDFQMVVASVRSVFPHVTLWATLSADFLIVASDRPIPFDLDGIQRRLDANAQVRADLADFGIRDAAGLLGLFELGETEVSAYAKGASLNTDDQLFLEFNAPWALYEDETMGLIRKELDQQRTKPFPAVRTAGAAVTERADFLASVGFGLLEKGLVDRARRMFEQALRIEPDRPDALAGLGRCALREGRPFTALPLLEKAAARGRGFAEASYLLGQARLQAEDPLRALEAFRQASSIDPQRWEFFSGQGAALERLERWDEAARAYRKALEMKPGRLPLAVSLAHSLNQSGRFEEASALLEPLRRAHPTYAPLYPEYGKANERLGRLALVITAFEELVRRNPYRPEHWMNLCRLYAKQRNLAKLRWAVRQGMRIDRFFPERMKTFGDALERDT